MQVAAAMSGLPPPLASGNARIFSPVLVTHKKRGQYEDEGKIFTFLSTGWFLLPSYYLLMPSNGKLNPAS